MKEKIYSFYKDDYLPELKKLSTKKLFVPSYVSIKFNGYEDGEINNDNIIDLFKKYKYKYEIISDEELNNRILNNEEFYYLRYVRTNTERFLQVVNSNTGEIVYRDYIPGLSYNLQIFSSKNT